MVGLKITDELFGQIKNELRYSDPLMVAIKNHASVKTILQIKGSQNFLEYRDQVKAQHPPTQFSMRDALIELNSKMDNLIHALTENKLL